MRVSRGFFYVRPIDVAKKRQKSTKAYPQKPLDEIDRQMLNLILGMPGITDEAIAEKVGYERTQIFKRRHNPTFQETLKEEQKSAIDVIREGQAKAARKVLDHIDSKDDGISLRASLALIDGLPEKVSGVMDDTAEAIAKMFAEMVSAAGAGKAAPKDNAVSE